MVRDRDTAEILRFAQDDKVVWSDDDVVWLGDNVDWLGDNLVFAGRLRLQSDFGFGGRQLALERNFS